MVHVVSVGVKENKTEQKRIVKEHLHRQGNKKYTIYSYLRT